MALSSDFKAKGHCVDDFTENSSKQNTMEAVLERETASPTPRMLAKSAVHVRTTSVLLYLGPTTWTGVHLDGSSPLVELVFWHLVASYLTMTWHLALCTSSLFASFARDQVLLGVAYLKYLFAVRR